MAEEVPSGFVTKSKHQRLVRKYNDLHDRHRELQRKYDEQKAELLRAFERTKAAEKIALSWKAWLNRHWAQVYGDENAPPEDHINEEPPRHGLPAAKEPIGSSQTTEDAPISSSPHVNNLPSDDVEFVSARSVGRRRTTAASSNVPIVRVKAEPTSPDNPLELASEEYSSPPIQRNKRVHAETSDLDEAVSHLRTPCKRQCTRAVSEEVSHNLGRPARALRTLSSLSEGEIDNMAIQRSPGVGAKGRAAMLQLPGQAPKSNALRPLSVNVPCSPRYSNKRNAKAGKRAEQSELRRNVAILSEDGDMQGSQAVTPPTNVRSPAKTNHTRLRLNSLLEGATPDKVPLPLQRSPQTAIRRPRKPVVNQLATPVIPAGTKQTLQHASPLHKIKRELQAAQDQPKELIKQQISSEDAPELPGPEDEPVRSRPLKDLQLSDFRINPAYLGADFAFADTLRGRERRRCLPGCMRPECCGNGFRKAIETGAVKSNKTETEALEAFLGPDWEHIMSTFGVPKRRDITLQAHAECFANEHGKHRQAYERHTTPPGYWRVDMPTTQETEEDRAKARELEQRQIEARWREALRPDGRWVFRDEAG